MKHDNHNRSSLRRLVSKREPAATPRRSRPDPPVAGRYDVALEEGRRSFDDQTAQVGKIRSVAGSLLGFGGVAFSILTVIPNPPSGRQSGLLIAAVILFAALAAVTVWIMWPVKLVPGVKATALVAWIDQDGSSDRSVKELALHYDVAYDQNQSKLSSRHRATMWALVLFSITVVVLVIRLIGT